MNALALGYRNAIPLTLFPFKQVAGNIISAGCRAQVEPWNGSIARGLCRVSGTGEKVRGKGGE